jgi:hypothetical protein
LSLLIEVCTGRALGNYPVGVILMYVLDSFLNYGLYLFEFNT